MTQRLLKRTPHCLNVARHAWKHPTKSNSLTCNLFLVEISLQKSKKLMLYYQRYWPKNPGIWLDKNVLTYNLRTTIFPDMGCHRKTENCNAYVEILQLWATMVSCPRFLIDHKFQWQQAGLNYKPLIYIAVT